MTIYALIVTVLLLILLFVWFDTATKLDVTRTVNEKLTTDLEREVRDSAFLRTSLNTVLNKQINITMTDAHLDHIAYAVSEQMKESKPWRN